MPSARDFWAILAAAPAVQMQRIDVGGSAAGTQTGLLGLRHQSRSAPADGRRDRQHRGHRRRRLLLRLRLVRGSVGRHRHAQRRDAVARRDVAVHLRSRAATRTTARSTRTTRTRHPVAQHRRRSDQASGLKAGGGLTETDLNRLNSYYDVNGDVGGYLKPDKIWWYGSLRDQKVQSLLPNFPVKPFETHLSNISAQGARTRSRPNNKVIGYGSVGQEETAEPARHVSDRRDRRHTHQPGLDVEPGLLGPHLQGRVEQRASAIARSSKSAAASSATCGRTIATRDSPAYAGSQHQHRQRRQPRRVVRHPDAQPGARLVQLLQGRLGRHRTTSRSAARSSTRGSTTSAGRTASATCLAT